MRLTQRARRIRTTVAAVVGVAVVATAGVFAVRALQGPVVVSERCTATASGETHDLDPEQAANAALISAVAVRRGLPARAATIAIATAIQESKLRNIDYGDRDSIGLFQQRPSQGWGTVEQIMDPLYSTNAFYDELVKIDGYETMEITKASHRVQRSAFPDAVAQREPQGRAFASALTGWSPGGLDCRLRAVSGSAGEPGADGLLPAASQVQAALDAELGTQRWDSDGPHRLLLSTGPGNAGLRRAWAVAHWAVASAARYDVVAVECDGRVWRRDQPGDGWVELPEDGGGAHAPAEGQGRVAIEVAGP